ncbi:hypothetical protein G195_006856 [Phytophthora kernoviae 00238/432]|uniref:N-acetyltransferase domain-containing protein n=1 Tax=Phytophthora kernoviae 00238/432 TaxID=1284355 RepID=A0A8J4SF53_9STRA|nr:hypothetical protein G195_006856 [Phytophthora kernoviae 00238/432]
MQAAEEGTGYQFGIFTIDDGVLIGQGGGRMTAAVKLAVSYAFRALKLNRVQAAILLSNTGSKRVLEKNGFQAEGIARKYLKINGAYQDHQIYAVLAEDLGESLQ